MPENKNNNKIAAGIENLLSESSIKDSDYQEVTTKKPGGDVVTIKSLQKMKLCNRLCESGTSEDFKYMSMALDLIESVI